MTEFLNRHILKKLLDNVNYSKNKGMIIASPSNDPPYKFHWVRDSSIVMKVIIDCYQKNKSKYFIHLINYIENVSCIQNLDTLTGLGEPKINITREPYNDPWGRPQNDGPALRGLNMLKIYKFFINTYPNITKELVIPALNKDLNYVLKNYNKICFDLWEEIQGWHFYTRLVQLKLLKEYIKLKEELRQYINLDEDYVVKVYNELKNDIKHHIGNNEIISSFDINGNIIRYDDASILLGLCHIDFDEEFCEFFTFDKVNNNCNNLLNYFREKYQLADLNMIGRYQYDEYYGGQLWIICSLGLAQFYFKYGTNTNNNDLIKLSHNILDYIVSIDINLDLAEQYNPNTDEQMSAEKLTWNYSELYFTNKNFMNA